MLGGEGSMGKFRNFKNGRINFKKILRCKEEVLRIFYKSHENVFTKFS